jgi:hypothetical protein
LIARTLDRAAGEIGMRAPETLDEVLATDQQARQLAQDLLPEVMRAEAG